MRIIATSDTHGNQEQEDLAARYIVEVASKIKKGDGLAFIIAGDFLPELPGKRGYGVNTVHQIRYLEGIIEKSEIINEATREKRIIRPGEKGRLETYFYNLKKAMMDFGFNKEYGPFEIYLTTGNRDYAGTATLLGEFSSADKFVLLNDKFVPLTPRLNLYGYKYSLPSPYQPKDSERWDSLNDRNQQRENIEKSEETVDLSVDDFDKDYNFIGNEDIKDLEVKPSTSGLRGNISSGSNRKINMRIANMVDDNSSVEKDFKRKKILEAIVCKGNKTGIIAHGISPFNTTLDLVHPTNHVGSKSFRKFLEDLANYEETYVPFSIHGHFHSTLSIAHSIEQYQSIEKPYMCKVGKTICLAVGNGNELDRPFALLDFDVEHPEEARRMVYDPKKDKFVEKNY